MINIETEIKTDRYELYLGDCLEVMDKLIEQNIKVDMILTDPPYGTTACKWDTIIPFNRHIEIENNHGKKQIMYENDYILQQFKTTNKSYQYILDKFNEQAKDGMWERLNKLIKSNGAIVLFGSEPFSSQLRCSNLKMYKYDWIWEKSRPMGFLEAKNKPMKKHEIISLFSNGNSANGCKNRITYNPQDLVEINKKMKNSTDTDNLGKRKSRPQGAEFMQTHTNYPNTILKFISVTKTVHPTQKPIELLGYLINTYTNENEIVLDFTMGSGSTGVACMNTNRKFIGIEKEEKYFDISVNRIEKAEIDNKKLK